MRRGPGQPQRYHKNRLPMGEMAMINMSYITQTSGGSCSICLSERLFHCVRSSCESISLVSKQATLPIPLKSWSQAEGEYCTCFLCFHNFTLFNYKQAITFYSNKYRAFPQKGEWCKCPILHLGLILFQLPVLKKQGYKLNLLLHPQFYNNKHYPWDYFKQLDLKLKDLILSSDFQPPCDIIC